MYDRSDRHLDLGITSIEANVGPGSYNPYSDNQYCDCGGYAPFGSFGERFVYNVTDEPSPSKYLPRLPACKHKKGCSTLRNRDSRFKCAGNGVPGPGSYDIKVNWPAYKKDPCNLMMTHTEDRIKPEIFCLDTEKSIDPPSIPAAHGAFGYTIGAYNMLVPQTRPQHDDTCGPAAYNPDPHSLDTVNSLRYKGNFWSKQTDVRKSLLYDFGFPAPCAYQSENNDVWLKMIANAKVRNEINSNRVLNVPRFIEKLSTTCEDSPGPDAYTLNDLCGCKNKFSVQAFDCTEERFKTSTSCTPAPNAYTCIQEKSDLSCVLKNQLLVPFRASDRRFQTFPNISPGPIYKLDGLTSELKRRIDKRRAKGFMVSFDSTDKRRPKLETKSEPGPADCQGGIVETKFNNGITSVFKSKTRKHQKPYKTDGPSPGVYDITNAFNALKCKCNNHVPPVGLKSESFLFTEPRFRQAKKLNNPGPNYYCISRALRNTGGKMTSRDARFKDFKDACMPGPAYYHIPTSMESSLRVDTFNSTMGTRVKYAPAPMKGN